MLLLLLLLLLHLEPTWSEEEGNVLSGLLAGEAKSCYSVERLARAMDRLANRLEEQVLLLHCWLCPSKS